jgi:hypothetical protein
VGEAGGKAAWRAAVRDPCGKCGRRWLLGGKCVVYPTLAIFALAELHHHTAYNLSPIKE